MVIISNFWLIASYTFFETRSHYVAQARLTLIVLPLSSMCWDHVALETGPRVSYMLGKQSTKWAPPLDHCFIILAFGSGAYSYVFLGRLPGWVSRMPIQHVCGLFWPKHCINFPRNFLFNPGLINCGAILFPDVWASCTIDSDFMAWWPTNTDRVFFLIQLCLLSITSFLESQFGSNFPEHSLHAWGGAFSKVLLVESLLSCEGPCLSDLPCLAYSALQEGNETLRRSPCHWGWALQRACGIMVSSFLSFTLVTHEVRGSTPPHIPSMMYH